jgi:nitrate reductase NapAB chaperone NapD
VEKVRQNSQQKTMENSFQQAHNLDGVFKINLDHKSCPQPASRHKLKARPSDACISIGIFRFSN